MVLVYSRPQCAPCQTLKYWLGKKGIDYKELPATDDMLAPTVKIGETIIVGLNFALLGKLLGL